MVDHVCMHVMCVYVHKSCMLINNDLYTTWLEGSKTLEIIVSG